MGSVAIEDHQNPLAISWPSHVHVRVLVSISEYIISYSR